MTIDHEPDDSQVDDAVDDAAVEATDALAGRLCDETDPCAAAAGVDRRRLADLRFLHVLLENLHAAKDGRNARRVQRAMQALDEWELALPAAAGEEPPRRGWLVSTFSAAAAVLAMVLLWNFGGGSPQTAVAAVQAVIHQAAHPVDRQYDVVSDIRLAPGPPITVPSRLYVRGGEKFALSHPGPLGGEIWIGSNGRLGWFTGPGGRLLTCDNPRFTLNWAHDEGVGLPELQLTSLLALLIKHHDLQFLDNEPLDEFAGMACQRVRATVRSDDGTLPKVIDLWAHPVTGVAHKIVLDWQRSNDEIGFNRITLVLAGEQPLDDDWYEVETHQLDSSSG